MFSRTACFRRACLLIRHNLKLFYYLLNKYYLAADFRYCSDFLFHGPLKYTCTGVIINCADTVEQTDGAHLKLRENFPDAMLYAQAYDSTVERFSFLVLLLLFSSWCQTGWPEWYDALKTYNPCEQQRDSGHITRLVSHDGFKAGAKMLESTKWMRLLI